ncbi:hypothetical protein C8F01DRAFT_1168712, partial [Mycena amicta]
MRRGVYAVAFAFHNAPDIHLLDLAWVLLRFQDLYIRESDYSRFDLVNISYRIGTQATYGLLIYDSGLAAAYDKVAVSFRSPLHGIPVSTWPPGEDNAAIKSDLIIAQLLSRVLRLAAL